MEIHSEVLKFVHLCRRRNSTVNWTVAAHEWEHVYKKFGVPCCNLLNYLPTIIHLPIYLFSPQNSLIQTTIVPKILTEVRFWFQFENYSYSFNSLAYLGLKLLQTVASLRVTRGQTRKPVPVSCRHLFLPHCTNEKGVVHELLEVTVRFTRAVKSAVNGLTCWNLFQGSFTTSNGVVPITSSDAATLLSARGQ
jgi:hypothetical protein